MTHRAPASSTRIFELIDSVPTSARSGWATLRAILRRADRIPIGDCCVTARREGAWVLRGLALTLSLLVLSAAGGDIGHALAGGTSHGLEPIIATAPGGPADQSTPAPASSHVATDCPFCRVARASSAALGGKIAWFTAVGERSFAAFLPQISAPSSRHPRANAQRAPPTRLSA